MLITAQEASDQATAVRLSKLATERKKVAETINAAVRKGEVSCIVQGLSAEIRKELKELGYAVSDGFVDDPREPYTTYTIRWYE